jgi:hypothetical protein
MAANAPALQDIGFRVVGGQTVLSISSGECENAIPTIEIVRHSLQDLGAFEENGRQGHRFGLNGAPLTIIGWGDEPDMYPSITYQNGDFNISCLFDTETGANLDDPGEDVSFDALVAHFQEHVTAANNEDPLMPAAVMPAPPNNDPQGGAGRRRSGRRKTRRSKKGKRSSRRRRA